MIKKIAVSIVAVLALGAGAAFAATQLASADATQVCVNQTNGLLRASSTCREGEYAMTIGGGSELRVTQQGSFTVTGSATSTPVTLPLTGVQVSGKFEVQTQSPYPEAGLARIVLSAPSAGTMDAFTTPGNVGTIGGTSLTTYPFAAYSGTGTWYGAGSAVVTANGATATITYGAQVNMATTPRTCTFLWQATEAPN